MVWLLWSGDENIFCISLQMDLRVVSKVCPVEKNLWKFSAVGVIHPQLNHSSSTIKKSCLRKFEILSLKMGKRKHTVVYQDMNLLNMNLLIDTSKIVCHLMLI